MKNGIMKSMNILCTILMVVTVFSATVTNVMADEEEKEMESLNPDVATDEYIHIVWQENLTGNYEIMYVNNAGVGNYERTLECMRDELENFKEEGVKKAQKNLDDALKECSETDYKHSIDRVHNAIKNLEKVAHTEITEIINSLIDSVRDLAKTNILYVEHGLSFNNSYVQEAWGKYYLAVKKYSESNYDAAIMQFKNSYLKLVEAYEEIGESFIGIDFGKTVRISHTSYDSITPQIFLNGTIHVGWVEEGLAHFYYARSTSNGITWWSLDATEHATPYLCYSGIDPYAVSLENTLLITRTLERIWILDFSHYFYVPALKDGAIVYSPIDDPYLDKYDKEPYYYEPVYIGDKKFYLPKCGPGIPLPSPKAPDLTVTGITFSNDKPMEGETITIYATIKNVGDADVSGTIRAGFFDSDISIGETTISSLVSAGSADVRNLWTVTTGNRVIKVVADLDNLVSEGNEWNNVLDTNRFVLYKWMEVGNYFTYEVSITQTDPEISPPQTFKLDAEILEVTSTTISIREIYSGENVKFSFSSTYELSTRKKLNTNEKNYRNWLWINNNDLLSDSVQIAGKIFILATPTSEYYVMTYSDSLGNESTLYYSKTNNMFMKSDEKTVWTQKNVTTTVLSTTERVPSTTVLTYEGVTTTVCPATGLVASSFRYPSFESVEATKSSATPISEPLSTKSATLASPTSTPTVFSDSMDSLSAWTISGGEGTSTTVFSDNMNSLSAWTVSGATTSTTMLSDNINTLSNWEVSTNKPGDTVTIFQETFEGVWPGQWVVGDSDPNSGEDYWGDSSYRVYAGSWSGYCADESDISGQYYDNNMFAYMVRSVSLGSYDSATLTFYLWLDSEIDYDYLYVIYYDSADSTWYWLCSATGYSGGWIYSADYIDIDIPTTATAVGFLFDSDSSITYEGAYLDNVVLTATTATEQWSLNSARYNSASYSAKCTPFSTYSNNLDTYMARSASLSGYSSAALSFYIWQRTETSYDFIYLQAYYSGAWNTLWSRSGSYQSWQQISVDIPTSATQIRFWFHSDYSITYEGVYIDDVVLTARPPYSWGPPYYGDGWSKTTLAYGAGAIAEATPDVDVDNGIIDLYAKAETGYPQIYSEGKVEATLYITGPYDGGFSVSTDGTYTICMTFLATGTASLFEDESMFKLCTASMTAALRGVCSESRYRRNGREYR